LVEPRESGESRGLGAQKNEALQVGFGLQKAKGPIPVRRVSALFS